MFNKQDQKNNDKRSLLIIKLKKKKTCLHSPNPVLRRWARTGRSSRGASSAVDRSGPQWWTVCGGSRRGKRVQAARMAAIMTAD